MLRYYIERGHAIHELLNLSGAEKAFYMTCMEMTAEEVNAVGK